MDRPRVLARVAKAGSRNAVLAAAAALTLALAWAWAFFPNKIESVGNPDFSEQGEMVYYRSRPFTGVRVDRFPNGKVYRETRYENGLKEGEELEFGVNGHLWTRSRYRAGKKDGFQEGWFLEGPKRFEARFKNGILDGEQTEWHINGNVFRKLIYAQGVEVANKTLYPTQEIYSNYVKKDGRVFGLDGGPLCFEKKREGEI